MTEKFKAIVKLIRPINFLITFISVVVAAFICQPDKSPGLNVFLAAFAASFALASGNIINDIFDIEIDKVNRPERPIPSGKIPLPQAYGLYISTLILSIFFSVFLNIEALLIVIISVVLLFFYSKYLKRIPFVGNITVSFLTGLVFVFGGVVVENPASAFIPAVFAFIINLTRELVKDIEDIDGDKYAGVSTFPIKFGFQKSKGLILLITITLILFTFYPFLTQLYKIEYFVFVMVIVNPILIYCMKILFEDQSSKNLNKISNLLKLSMVFGLIAIFFGV